MTGEQSWRRRWYRFRYGVLEFIQRLPLIVGSLIVLALMLAAISAPFTAPHSPYEKRGYGLIGNEWIPPYSPSSVYPLGSDSQGRDMLSLLIYGAQQTLLLTFVVTLARLTVGCLVGGLAAWKEGRPAEQLLMSLSTAFSSFPALVLAGLLVLAFGIQVSLTSFTIALCFVGWGEIAQFVHTQALVIRRKEYVESARSIGLRETAIAVRHVLPNILPQLVAVLALEMAAVLLLLGELGFLNIFFGGGSRTTYEVVGGEQIISTFEVPEWGAMLATSRQHIRNRPWVALYPASAFFIAAAGFSLMGVGLRRLADRGRLNLGLFFNRYVLGGLATLVVTTYLLMTNAGPLGTLIRISRRADGYAALAYTRQLSAPEFGGRRAGTPEADAASEYLAAELENLGLLPAGQDGTYFQTFSVTRVDLARTPQLILWDRSGNAHPYRHRADFREILKEVLYLDSPDHALQAGSGSADRAEVVYSPHSRIHVVVEVGAYHWSEWPDRILFPQGVRDKVVLTTWGPDFDYMVKDGVDLGVRGILLIAEDDGLVGHRDAFPPRIADESLPILLVTHEVAEDLVAGSGYTLEQLERRKGGSTPLGVQVSLSVQLADRGPAVTRNVLALYPGADPETHEAVILAAHYDGLGQDPDGTRFPGANDGASGCGTLLAVAKLWREQGFVPQRPVLFAFWSGQEEDTAGARAYLDCRTVSSPEKVIANYVSRPVGVVHLDYAGRGGRLAIGEFLAGFRGETSDTTAGNRLNRLIRSSARMLWAGTTQEILYLGMSPVSLQTTWGHRPFIVAGMPAAMLRRSARPGDIRTHDDTADRLSPSKLRGAVQVMSLLGMRLANGR